MSLATKAVYAVLLPLFLPVHVMLMAALRKAFAAARKAPRVPTMLERHPTTAELPTPTRIDPPVELDYLEHRSLAIVSALAFSAAWEAARGLTGKNDAEDVAPEDLARDLVSSRIAFMISRTADGDAWVLDVEPIRRGLYWNADRFDIVRFVFDVPSGRYELHDAQGQVYRPVDPLWRGAKRKLIAQLAVWEPIGGHTWAHYWLPDVVAATVHESLARETLVYRLLAPHVRFASRHNHAGLWIQRATSNTQAASKRLVPWLTLPCTALSMRRMEMDGAGLYHRSADHFALPERLDRRLPYCDFLAAYFEVVDAFVGRLMPHLEADAYAAWAAVVEGWYPGFAKVPMQRALSMIVWHMGVAHSADHFRFVAWGRRYGTAEVAPSIAELATRRPSAYERYRYLTFLNNFAAYRPPTTGLDLRLSTSDQEYGFPAGSAAEAAARQFVAGLRALDTRLQAEGKALVPLDQLIRAICY